MGTMHESDAAITAYVHLLRLTMAFLTMIPSLSEYLENKVQLFHAKSENRSKAKIGDMGEFIILCILARKTKFEHLKSALFEVCLPLAH